MLCFDDIISFDSLYRAHRRARLGKRHKKEVIEFEAALSENLWALHYDLKYGKYVVGDYRKFMIHDPKEREIQAISYRDRIVQHSLCDGYLMPLLDKHLIYDNAACRREKGTLFAIKRLRKFMCEYYKGHGKNGYFVKVDVSKYFPSIEHDLLKKKMDRIVKDERVRSLLYLIIDSYESTPNRGLPMGNQSSQCFALLYLNDLDKFFKERMRVKYYVRYMDDILMLVPSKERARDCLLAARSLLEAEALLMNEKSQIIAVKNGVSFIGWHFYFGERGTLVQTICAPSRRHILARVRALRCSKVKRRCVRESYRGYLTQGQNFYFAERAWHALS